MRLRTWPLLAAAFGTLVLLTALFGLDRARRAQQIYVTLNSIHEAYLNRERAIEEIRSAMLLSGILARDYLLDPTHLTADLHRGQLVTIKKSMTARLDDLDGLTGPMDRNAIDRLRDGFGSYWVTMDPIFTWTPQQKMALSALFLSTQVLPRRNAVLRVAQQVADLNASNFRERQQRIDESIRSFQRNTTEALVFAISLGVLVAGVSIFRISRLESRAERQHQQTERAERELRRLSQQLVRAQEEERRSISRELHDEVGQTLTALRVELGNLEALRNGASDRQFLEHMEDAKTLAEQTLRAVRDLAMGLRPSMLDDLGLGPALQWQAREFSRRTGTLVQVSLDGLPESLPDGYRTCLYRVVQEALTNCAGTPRLKISGSRCTRKTLGWR